LNKQDFVDWKRHPVTQVVFSQLQERVQNLYEMLGSSAGQDPVQDSQFVGGIKAYKDMLDIEYDVEEEKE
jgi:hypothetical protein